MRRILVVDDNEDARTSIAELLAMNGFEARAVADGPSALAAAQAERPDVVLLDLSMPGMSGYEVAPRLRALPGGDELLIIALSGRGSPDVAAKTRRAGIDMHVLKPVGMAALRALL
jgi:CheY-like chemotaxis protein